MRNLTQFIATLAAAFVFTGSLSAASADATELAALREQVRVLEQQLKVIARQLEIKEEVLTAAPPTAPVAAAAPAKITINDRGYTFASADSANFIKLRELVQVDSRLFFGDGGGITNNAFVFRRGRLIAEGALARNYGYQFVTEFGGSSVSILEANFSVTLAPALQLRFGRFKEPIGFERLQSDFVDVFNERSIATNLMPDRDVGVQASGDFAQGHVNYALGVFNGLPDGANNTTNTDFDNEKAIAGRVFVSPFKGDLGSPVQGLGFGVGGSVGRQKTASGRASGYRTDGQQTFFAYNPSVVANGQTWRVSPQAEYRIGPFGAIGEYAISTVNVRPTATGAKSELKNKAWQLAAGYVLTGENSAYAGVAPARDFDWSAGTWGALEVVGRFADLKVDDQTFPTFASAASNAADAKSWGFGFNWYLSKAVAFKSDYYQTHFGFSPLAPAVSTTQFLRQDEKAFITRFQLSF